MDVPLLLEGVVNLEATFGTTAKTVSTWRKARSEALRQYWDGMSEILRYMIIEKWL